jgi:hypothetical protein
MNPVLAGAIIRALEIMFARRCLRVVDSRALGA